MKTTTQRGMSTSALKSRQAFRLRPNAVGLLIAACLIALICASLSCLAIKLQPEGSERYLWSGEEFITTCQNNKNIKNVKIKWFAPNGDEITEDRSRRVHAESSGSHGHRLVIMNLTLSKDAGKYRCSLANDRTRETIETDLKIYESPNFKDTSRDVQLTVNKTGKLTCRVEFDKNSVFSSVTWLRDDRLIEMLNDSSYEIQEYDSSSQTSHLIMKQVQKQHGATYTCRALAETPQRTKLVDHNINLKVRYAPMFDQSRQTIWVDRHLTASSSSHPKLRSNIYAAATNQPGDPQSEGVPSRLRNNIAAYQRKPQPRLIDADDSSSSQFLGTNNQTSQSYPTVIVELRCSCMAYPPASIMWYSDRQPNLELTKGQPAHVVEVSKTSNEGDTAVSILTIEYVLDPNWPHKSEEYICDASNVIDQRPHRAHKRFNIEQGDLPPAFSVLADKKFDSTKSMLSFVVREPNFDPDASREPQSISNQNAQLPHHNRHIVPPIDSFRIVADSGSGEHSKLSQPHRHNHNSDVSSVQWNVYSGETAPSDTQSRTHQVDSELDTNMILLPMKLPQNYTINLSKLPSGSHKLFLEAHNGVGWSPNATYLGEYYIVSGSSSIQLNRFVLFGVLSLSILALGLLGVVTKSAVGSGSASKQIVIPFSRSDSDQRQCIDTTPISCSS